MPPQRTDAAIAPYLTHPISHHDPTLAPPDNNGRRRKAKQTPREEPVRFSGTPTVPSTSSGRSSWRIRRHSRTEERYNANDIPDYPPPSFQEAIRSPPVSVCPSTTTLGLFTTPQVSRHNYNSDSESEFDDASFDIADTANSGRSPGPTVERLPLQSQTLPRGRGVLDSDPDDPVRAPSSLNPRAHRRHLSLSPLRTLFPSRSPRESGHALSAQSTPSPYSLAFARSSPFSRSTTSLRNLTSTTALAPPSPSSPPSLRSENFLAPRRFFSHKGKERATSEALDSWEIVESELPAAPPTLLSQSEEVSPVQDVPSGDIPPQSPVSVTTIHPLSERDRQVKSKNRAPPPVSIPARERERRPPPPPPPVSSVPLAPGEGPPIVTVRVKKPPPPPPPKKKPQPVSSPLRDADRRCALPELDLDRAVRTPLPLTPVTGSPTSLFSVTAEPGSPAQERIDPACHVLSSAPGSSPGAVENGDVDIVDIEGQQPLPHHYPGRPLPRRPRVVVDSTYAPHPDFPQVELLPQPPSVPEGLLIDLDAAETPTVGTPHNQPIASVSGDLIQLAPRATDLRRNSSASSVDLAPAAPPAQFLEVTDLDILLARLENDQRDGGNYDALLMVSDFIGPATPVRANGPTLPSMPWQSSAKTSILSTGHIEVLRRRTTKDGRVKLKLALLGIAVDRCGICMTQFKKAERAQLSEGCKHVFHDRCLARWVVRSRTCPLCRVVLDLSASCL